MFQVYWVLAEGLANFEVLCQISQNGPAQQISYRLISTLFLFKGWFFSVISVFSACLSPLIGKCKTSWQNTSYPRKCNEYMISWSSSVCWDSIERVLRGKEKNSGRLAAAAGLSLQQLLLLGAVVCCCSHWSVAAAEQQPQQWLQQFPACSSWGVAAGTALMTTAVLHTGSCWQ